MVSVVVLDGHVTVVGSMYYPKCAPGLLNTVTVEYWNTKAPSESLDVGLTGAVVATPGGGVGAQGYCPVVPSSSDTLSPKEGSTAATNVDLDSRGHGDVGWSVYGNYMSNEPSKDASPLG